MPEQPALRQWLFAHLARLTPHFEGELDEHTPLMEDGLCLDSLAVVDLIGAIHEEFGVRIREEEISPDVFGTTGQLLTFLTRLLGEPRLVAVEGQRNALRILLRSRADDVDHARGPLGRRPIHAAPPRESAVIVSEVDVAWYPVEVLAPGRLSGL